MEGGTPFWEGHPDFSGNVPEESGIFPKIFRSGADVFLKSSAAEPDFFRNPQLGTRSFFVILSS
jgi:hypothetical protein